MESYMATYSETTITLWLVGKVNAAHNHIIVQVGRAVERTPARRPSKTKDTSGLGLC